MEVRTVSRLSINLRWLGIAYVCLVLGIAVLGVQERFFPALGYQRAAVPWAWAHAVFCGVLTLAAGRLPDLKTGKRPPFIYFLISAPVMVYAGYASIVGGLPYIAHLLNDRPRGQVVFRIDDFTLKHGSCKNGLKVASPEYGRGRVCGLSQGFRNRLSVGDRVVLRGPRSAWGIHWDDLNQTN